jgi:hypothetical protein
MDGDGIYRILLVILVGGITAFVAIAVVDSIVTSGMAPQPGDPLYSAWQSLIGAFRTTIVLVVPGILLVLGFILSQLRGR